MAAAETSCLPECSSGLHRGSNSRKAAYMKEHVPLLEWRRGFRVKIPTLGFQVKATSSCIHKELGPNALNLRQRLGINIVKVRRTQPGGLYDWPCASDKLAPGFQCWVIPAAEAWASIPPMPDGVGAEEARGLAARNNEALRQVFSPCYRLASDVTKEVSLAELQSGCGRLFGLFLQEFDLQAEDLRYEPFDCFAITYPPAGPDATIGSTYFATAASAARRRCELPPSLDAPPRGSGQRAREAWRGAVRLILELLGPCTAQRVLAAGLPLAALNMRYTFDISPVAVIHGGRNAYGTYELPVLPETVVRGGDRLLFFFPGAGPGAQGAREVGLEYSGSVQRLRDPAFLWANLEVGQGYLALHSPRGGSGGTCDDELAD